MGKNKSKLNKHVVESLVQQTGRSPQEIKNIYTIFLQHFNNGRIESAEDLYRCLRNFSLVPAADQDPSARLRLYRLFQPTQAPAGADASIDFYRFMCVFDVLERGTSHQKIFLYFKSFDVDNDNIITRQDLEASLPPTVESRQVIQELLRRWDTNNDGVVNLDDFERYILSNPTLSVLFTGAKERVRMDSVVIESTTEGSPNVYQVNPPTRAHLFSATTK